MMLFACTDHDAPAIAFTYFEALLRVGDVNKFEDEEARLRSLGNLLEHVGYRRDIWYDFAEPAFELLRKLADSLRIMDGAAADILLQTFNDMGESMGIITYVKVSSCISPFPLEQ
jgi:ubiquitin thioesterase protein OTUB1